MSSRTSDAAGARWHRWDPHLHAPGSLAGDQFGGDWQAYFTRLESAFPAVRALGVTDLHGIGAYREARRQRELCGRLPDVALLFPNVELRLDVEVPGQKPIGVHLLFSPDDPQHEAQIERCLGQLTFTFEDVEYHCTTRSLTELGRIVVPRETDDAGALQAGANRFRVGFHQLRHLFREEPWMREHCLLAVAVRPRETAAGLQNDESYVARRRMVERLADIVLASQPSQRAFWLGQTPFHDRRFIVGTYGGLKPCLLGSETSRDDGPASALERYTWVKGELAFRTLRQAALDPEERVWLGARPPVEANPAETIAEVRFDDAPPVNTPALAINPALVAVVGAPGSGRTALLDMIALGAQAAPSGTVRSAGGEWRRDGDGEAATPAADDAGSQGSVALVWGDGSIAGPTPLDPARQTMDGSEGARYLSRDVLQELCCADAPATARRQDVERIVFENTPARTRGDAASMDEWAGRRLDAIRKRRTEQQRVVCEVSLALAEERAQVAQLPRWRRRVAALARQVATDRKVMAGLLPADKAAHVQLLTALEAACAVAERRVEALVRRRQMLERLARDVAQMQAVDEPARHDAMVRTFRRTGLPEADWDRFRLHFRGDVEQAIVATLESVNAAIVRATEGGPDQSYDPAGINDWPLTPLVTQRDAVKKLVGLDAERQKKYDERRQLLSQRELALRRLEDEIAHAEDGEARRAPLVEARRTAYVRFFETLVEEEAVLAELCGPVQAILVERAGALSQMAIRVRREIEVDEWCQRGVWRLERRVPLDAAGRDALTAAARTHLLPAWTSGSAAEAGAAMHAFLADVDALLQPAATALDGACRDLDWHRAVAEWLFDLSHIVVGYDISYEGVAFDQLSPETRTFVIMLLHLAVDRADTRPLLIDPPPENPEAGPGYVELVPHLRDARQRRQIIAIVESADLLASANVDQVIVAERMTAPDGRVRTAYRGGEPANPAVRSLAVKYLPGSGERFEQRERWFEMKWRDEEPDPARLAAALD